MTQRTNLYISKNTDFSVPLQFSDDEGPLDLEGISFISHIRKFYSSEAIADFSFNVSDIETGEVVMYLQKEKTSQLVPGKYEYDILMIQHNTVSKIVEGIVFIESTVTSNIIEINDD